MAIIKITAKGCYFCDKKKDLIKLHIAAPFQENHNNSLNEANICKDCRDKLITILDRDYTTKDPEKKEDENAKRITNKS